jgi:hypothetical protein
MVIDFDEVSPVDAVRVPVGTNRRQAVAATAEALADALERASYGHSQRRQAKAAWHREVRPSSVATRHDSVDARRTWSGSRHRGVTMPLGSG